MGISGLLPLLKSIQKPSNLRSFKGQTIGVDGYGWLHRGATACAIQLALGQPTTKYVEFAMNRVRLLQHCGVVPYLVFDGDYLPSKAGTENDRLARREEAKRLGSELLRHGKTAQAHQEMQKAVDVTPEMAGLFIQELRKANIKYVVAPFEADSQLAYLEKHKQIDAVISEDSDLLVFGVRVLLTKLDQFGECVMIRQDDFQSCREISMANWELRTFRQMAILSGCDYLDNIPNFGLKTAHRLLRKHKTVERTLQAMRLEGKFKVPPTYMEEFTRAELTFLHQWVFCPMSKTMVNLNPVEKSQDLDKMMLFIGKSVEAKLAAGVADGSLHPHTKKPLVLPSIGNLQSKLTPLKVQQENVVSKKETSITEFFKKRQPLAELDPNSFIMTPRQQELARNAASSSWMSPMASSASLNQSSAISNRVMRAGSLDTPTQGRVKRQRLCHEADDILRETQDIKSVMTGSSKFFTSTTSKNKSKRHFRGFSIYSDDLIDDALNALPEPASQTITDGKKAAKQTSSHAAVKTIRSTKFDESQAAHEDDSQITLVTVVSPEAVVDGSFDDGEVTFVQEEIVEDQTQKKSGIFDDFAFSTGNSGLNSSIPSAIRHQPLVLSETRSEVRCSKDIVLKAVCAVSETIGSATTPTTSPLAPVDHLAQLTKGRGSEDQIVSDSEGEDDEPPRSPKVLDFTKYALVASA